MPSLLVNVFRNHSLFRCIRLPSKSTAPSTAPKVGVKISTTLCLRLDSEVTINVVGAGVVVGLLEIDGVIEGGELTVGDDEPVGA